jgi:hypothetical protein
MFEVTTLTEDVELIILTFCDISSVLKFSYCNHDKYELVHKSNWLWEQHARAEALYNIEEPVDNWKEKFIEVYSTSFDLSLNHEECKDHYHIAKQTISRPVGNKKHFNMWERFLSKKTILPRTITLVEFRIDLLDTGILSRNSYLTCVGITGKDQWKHDESWHQNIIGASNGCCFIVGSAQTLVNCQYNNSEMKTRSGDRICIIIDNGYSERNTVTVKYSLNDEPELDFPVNYKTPLRVGEFKAGLSLFEGQTVTLTKMKILKK